MNHSLLGTWIVASLTILTVITNQGCVPLVVGAAVGAGSYAYVKGELEKSFDFPVATLHDSALKVLRQQGNYIVSDEVNVHNSKIKAINDPGDSIHVEVIAITEKAARIKIRIGVFGDESKSFHILRGIEEDLGVEITPIDAVNNPKYGKTSIKSKQKP